MKTKTKREIEKGIYSWISSITSYLVYIGSCIKYINNYEQTNRTGGNRH